LLTVGGGVGGRRGVGFGEVVVGKMESDVEGMNGENIPTPRRARITVQGLLGGGRKRSASRADLRIGRRTGRTRRILE
jgi:hypothetical protein